MSNSLQVLRELCIQLSEPIIESLSNFCDNHNVSIKPILESLLPQKTSLPISFTEDDVYLSIKDLRSNVDPTFYSLAAESALRMLSKAYASAFCDGVSKNVEGLGLDFSLIPEEKRLVVEIVPKVLPLLKERIKARARSINTTRLTRSPLHRLINFYGLFLRLTIHIWGSESMLYVRV